MKRKLLTVALLMIGATTPTNSQEDNVAGCELYGAIGGVVLDVMLPATFEDLIKMMRGENQELLGSMSKAMISAMSNAAVGKAATLGENKMQLLGNAAGQHVVQLAMAGQVATAEEARNTLTASCARVGVDAIIQQSQVAQEALNSVR